MTRQGSGPVAPPSGRKLRTALAWSGLAAAALALVAMPQLRAASFHASFYDLGTYVSTHHAVAELGLWQAAFNTHTQPAILLYGLAYLVAPGAATLLLLQSLALLAGGLVYAAYWRARGLPGCLVPLALYGLSFPVWFSALFDFHFEHLLFPILIGFFLLARRPGSPGNAAALLAAGLAPLAVKEVYGLTTSMLGLVLLLQPGHRRPAVGLVLLGSGFAAFFLLTARVIPAFSGGAGSGELWGSAFGYLGASIGEIAGALARRPWLVIGEILGEPRKLLYLGALFGALAFVPLGRPLALLPALPVLAIALLSRNPNHYYLGHQYTAAVAAPLLVAFADTVARLEPGRARAATAAAIGMSAVTLAAFGPSPVSRLFWDARAWGYHWTAYRPTPRDRMVAEAIDAAIAPGSDAVVSMQNTLTADRLSGRLAAFAFPYGVVEPVRMPVPDGTGAMGTRAVLADIVVIDLLRPAAFRDRVCRSPTVASCDDPALKAAFLDAVAALEGRYRREVDRDGLLLFRRTLPGGQSPSPAP